MSLDFISFKASLCFYYYLQILLCGQITTKRLQPKWIVKGRDHFGHFHILFFRLTLVPLLFINVMLFFSKRILKILDWSIFQINCIWSNQSESAVLLPNLLYKLQMKSFIFG